MGSIFGDAFTNVIQKGDTNRHNKNLKCSFLSIINFVEFPNCGYSIGLFKSG